MKRIAIIGFGNIGKKHLAALHELGGFEIHAIIDPYYKPENTKGISHFLSLDEYLAQVDLAEVVAICTPNSMHASQAIKCMENGMHVLIEKPMAIEKQDAERVIATSLQTNTKVFCVMQLRYSPIVSWLKNLLSRNLLGTIYSVEVRCFWNRNKAYYQPAEASHQWRGKLTEDKGPLYTQFSHFVDLVYYLLGAWNINHAEFNNFNHQDFTEFEDSGRILFNVENTSGIFSYTTSVFEKNYESTITIVGSKGTVSIGGQYFNQIRYTHPADLPKIDEVALSNYAQDRLAGHVHMYQNVLDAIESKQPITTNALDGLKVVEMIEAVYAFRSL